MFLVLSKESKMLKVKGFWCNCVFTLAALSVIGFGLARADETGGGELATWPCLWVPGAPVGNQCQAIHKPWNCIWAGETCKNTANVPPSAATCFCQ